MKLVLIWFVTFIITITSYANAEELNITSDLKPPISLRDFKKAYPTATIENSCYSGDTCNGDINTPVKIIGNVRSKAVTSYMSKNGQLESIYGGFPASQLSLFKMNLQVRFNSKFKKGNGRFYELQGNGLTIGYDDQEKINGELFVFKVEYTTTAAKQTTITTTPTTTSAPDKSKYSVDISHSNITKSFLGRKEKKYFEYFKADLEDRLKAPATAKYKLTKDVYVKRNNKDAYSAFITVDAQNPMGAYIRSKWFCWYVLDLPPSEAECMLEN